MLVMIERDREMKNRLSGETFSLCSIMNQGWSHYILKVFHFSSDVHYQVLLLFWMWPDLECRVSFYTGVDASHKHIDNMQ